MVADVTSYADRLERCYTAAVYDVLRAIGYPDQVLPPDIRPLDPASRLAGEVFTVQGQLDPELSAHESLLRWTGLLSRAPRGSVVLCQPNDHSLAHMGELSAETMTLRGVRGYIVDGGCRDSARVLEVGFRVWCRYLTPRDVVGRWSAERFGEPITIGGVEIRSGDYVLADRDGVVVVPGGLVADVVARTEAVLETENRVRTAILAGVDPQEAYLLHGKF